eukprot:COSAG02_NODE_10325_length_1967_cov_32.788009_2_plen_75_part_00
MVMVTHLEAACGMGVGIECILGLGDRSTVKADCCRVGAWPECSRNLAEIKMIAVRLRWSLAGSRTESSKVVTCR